MEICAREAVSVDATWHGRACFPHSSIDPRPIDLRDASRKRVRLHLGCRRPSAAGAGEQK